MKKIRPLFIFITTLFLCSCNSEKCNHYIIRNFYDKTITLEYYSNNKMYKKTTINSLSSAFEDYLCSDKGILYLNYSGTDSVKIKSDGILKKTYYPNDEGKSIFKIRDANSWELQGKYKHYEKYVYKIVDKDFD